MYQSLCVAQYIKNVPETHRISRTRSVSNDDRKDQYIQKRVKTSDLLQENKIKRLTVGLCTESTMGADLFLHLRDHLFDACHE